MSEEYLSPEQIRHNQKLCELYPLGQMDSMWTLAEHLYSQFNAQYKPELNALFDAIHNLDQKIRADRFPLPKKVEQSNGILSGTPKRRTGKKVSAIASGGSSTARGKSATARNRATKANL